MMGHISVKQLREGPHREMVLGSLDTHIKPKKLQPYIPYKNPSQVNYR